MDFTIDKTVLDENGQEQTVTTTYKASLENGTATVSVAVDDNLVDIISQPWKPNGDGTRTNWSSVEEVVEWFKTDSGLGA